MTFRSVLNVLVFSFQGLEVPLCGIMKEVVIHNAKSLGHVGPLSTIYGNHSVSLFICRCHNQFFLDVWQYSTPGVGR